MANYLSKDSDMATETDVCNIAGGKIGGFGDILNGTAFISGIDDSNKVSTFCKFTFPRVRRRSIVDLASRDVPYRETIRFADLGNELSSVPEIGVYEHAFNLPGDCLSVVRQFNEDSIATRYQPGDYVPAIVNQSYQFETVANAAGNGKILLTDILSNSAQTSAFIEYVIDIPTVGDWSEQMIDAVATLLAAELCPVVGRDMETRLALTQEYLAKSIPDAKRVNQKGFNNSARPIRDFKGGRSTTLPTV